MLEQLAKQLQENSQPTDTSTYSRLALILAAVLIFMSWFVTRQVMNEIAAETAARPIVAENAHVTSVTYEPK